MRLIHGSAMSTVHQNAIKNAHRLLGKCVLFRGLQEKDRDAMVARARLRHFKAGETIFLMGETGDSLLAVLDGQVRISVPSTGGRELLLAILHPGEFFGEMAVLDGKPRTADAHAITDCDLAVLSRTDVLAFLHSQPEALISLVDVLCDRLRQTDRHIAEVALLNLPVRLAKVLLRIAKLDETPRLEWRNITINKPQRELASMIGGARESVNKCLRQWQQAGLVRVEDSSITITNPIALAEIAETS
jgi:CRP/FNR family transcriptional regulator, cyclic AMP receptor protein